MTSAPTTSVARSHAAGVAAALDVPERIVRAVYADHVFPPSKPLTEMLADCSRLLRAQDAKHAAGHWTASASRRAALAQAEDAILALIAADPLPLSNAA